MELNTSVQNDCFKRLQNITYSLKKFFVHHQLVWILLQLVNYDTDNSIC